MQHNQSGPVKQHKMHSKEI